DPGFFRKICSSRAGCQALPDQFDSLYFSIHLRRWCTQCDSIALKFHDPDQVFIHVVLNRRDLNVVRYFVTVEGISSGVGKKCLEGFRLFLERAAAGRQRLPPAVTNESRYSTVRRISEKSHRGWTVGSFIPLSFCSRSRGRHQLPGADKFLVRLSHPDSPLCDFNFAVLCDLCESLAFFAV